MGDRTLYYIGLKERIERAARGKRTTIVAEAAEFLAISPQAVYAGLRGVGWRSNRKPRCDRRDVCLTDEELEFVANILSQSRRANGKRLLSARRAQEIALANGRISRTVAPGTLLRLLRERGIHPDQLNRPSPHVSMASRHPNHVWQFDVSVCVLFYLDHGGVGVMDEKTFYKNKPKNLARVSKQRVLRYLVTDHTSGAFFVRYYQVAGEDQATLFTFLMEAFAEKPEHILHGVPQILIWDAGSANQAHAIKALLDALDVDHRAHMPGNPRAKGQVEQTHEIIECDFEGALYLMQVDDLEALNRAADIWQISQQSTEPHSRHGHTRFACWQTVRPEQLRLCPPVDLCRELMHSKPEPRRVNGDLSVQYKVKGFDSAFYGVGDVPGVRVGDQVLVTVNPYRAPSIFVLIEDEEGGEQRIECHPIARDQYGFPVDAPVYGEGHRAAADTGTDQARKRMDKAAYGGDTLQEVDKARSNKQPAFNGEIDPVTYLAEKPKPEFIRRPGTELHLPQTVQVELKPLSHVEAMKLVRSRLSRALTPEDNAQVRRWYPNGVPEDELESLIERLNANAGNTPALTVAK